MPCAARHSATAEPAPPAIALSSRVTKASWLFASSRIDVSSSGFTKRMLTSVASSSPAIAAAQVGLAELQGVQLLADGDAGAGAARVTDRGGAGVLEAGAEHHPALVLVGRCHDHEVGQAAQEAEIEAARVGGAVRTDHAGAVDREGDVEVLQR